MLSFTHHSCILHIMCWYAAQPFILNAISMYLHYAPMLQCTLLCIVVHYVIRYAAGSVNCLGVNNLVTEPFIYFEGHIRGILYHSYCSPLQQKDWWNCLGRIPISKDFGFSLEERVLLCADDILLYISNSAILLTTALPIIERLGRFSGFRVTGDESNIFPLDCKSTRTIECILPLYILTL